MDSDKQKDVSGGAIFSGNANNSGTEPNAISSGSIAADTQAAGMPHSFSAHRPTKVIANVPGDIILTNTESKPKRRFNKKTLAIAGCVAAFALLLVGLGFLLVDNTDRVKTLLSEKAESVQVIENIFAASYYGELAVDDLFTPSKNTEINAAMQDFAQLQQELSKIRPSSVKKLSQADYKIVQERLNERIVNYQAAIDLYNRLYNAYVQDSADSIADLLTNENYYTAITAERFTNYINSQKELEQVIEINDCYSGNAPEICIPALAEYAENTSSLQGSKPTIQAIFTTDDNLYYSDDMRIVPHIQILMQEQN